MYVTHCMPVYHLLFMNVFKLWDLLLILKYFQSYENIKIIPSVVLITYENAVMLSRTWIFYWRIGSWKLLSKLDPMWQNTLIFKDEIALKFPIESAVRTRKWKKFQNTRITLILRDDLDLFELRVKHVDYFILYYLVSFTLVWFIFWFTRRILFIWIDFEAIFLKLKPKLNQKQRRITTYIIENRQIHFIKFKPLFRYIDSAV